MLTACSGLEAKKKTGDEAQSKTQAQTIPLEETEKELLEKVEEDIHKVKDDAYIQTLIELIGHTDNYAGQLYQLEGIYTTEGETAYITRTLVNGEETMELGLPLNYLNKDILVGTWIKVTGIVNSGEVNGEPCTVLEVVAVEAPSKVGLKELEWDGTLEHQHQ